MNIRGKSVVLRAIERSDLDQLHGWSNDPDIWYQLGDWHFPYTRASLEDWFESLGGDATNQRFAIEAPGSGLIGTANLVEIDWKDRRASTGLMLGSPAQRGKGYGRDTIMAIMRYAFEELQFERLDASIIEYNAASLHVYLQKCGWQLEGRQRRWYFRRDRRWDRVLIGITREEYAALAQTTKYWDA